MLKKKKILAYQMLGIKIQIYILKNNYFKKKNKNSIENSYQKQN